MRLLLTVFFSVLFIAKAFSQDYLVHKESIFPVKLRNGAFNLSMDGDSILLSNNHEKLEGPLIGDLFVVRDNRKKGIINSKNEYFVTDTYDEIYLVENWICLKSNDSLTISNRESSLTLKADTIFSIGTGIYETVSNEKHGIISLSINQENSGEFNYFLTPKQIIPTIYDEVGIWGEYFLALQGEKACLINQDGIQLFKPNTKKFELVNDSIIRIEKDKGWKYIHESGKALPHVTKKPVIFYSEGYYKIIDERIKVYQFSSGLPLNLSYSDLHFNGKFVIGLTESNLVDLLDITNFSTIIKSYEDIRIIGKSDKQTFILFKKEGKYGLMDSSNREIIPNDYTWIEPQNLHWLIYQGDRTGLVDSEGNVLIKPTYDNITIQPNHFLCHNSGKLAVHDKNGKILSSNTICTEQLSNNTFRKYLALRAGDYIEIYSRDSLVFSHSITNAYFQDSLIKIYELDKIHLLDFSRTGEYYGKYTYDNISSSQIIPKKSYNNNYNWSIFVSIPNYFSSNVNYESGAWGTIDKRTSKFHKTTEKASQERLYSLDYGVLEIPNIEQEVELVGDVFYTNKTLLSLRTSEQTLYNRGMIGINNSINHGQTRPPSATIVHEKHFYQGEFFPLELSYVDLNHTSFIYRFNKNGELMKGFYETGYEFTFNEFINSINDYEGIQVQNTKTIQNLCNNDLKVKLEGGDWYLKSLDYRSPFKGTYPYDYVHYSSEGYGLRKEKSSKSYEVFNRKNDEYNFNCDSAELKTFGENLFVLKYVQNSTSEIFHLQKGITPEFSRVSNFSFLNDVTLYKSRGELEAINAKGKVINISKLTITDDFKNGTAIFEQRGRYGIINNQGEILTEQLYEGIIDMDENFKQVLLEGNYGIINSEGKEILPAIYDKLYDPIDGYILAKKNGLYELIDLKNSNVTSFSEKPKHIGADIVAIKKRRRVILEKGNSEQSISRKKITDYNGQFSTGWLQISIKKGKENYISPTGQLLTETGFKRAFPFENEVALVLSNSQWSLINTSGNSIISGIDNYVDYWGEYYLVNLDGDDIYIDINGTINSLLSGYKKIGKLNNQVCVAITSNRKKVLIDKHGNLLNETEFDEIGEFKGGFAEVMKGNKKGIIDISGNWYSINEDNSTYIGGGFYSQAKSLLKGLCLFDGTELIPPLYDNIEIINYDLFYAISKNLKTVYNSKGEIIYSDSNPL